MYWVSKLISSLSPSSASSPLVLHPFLPLLSPSSSSPPSSSSFSPFSSSPSSSLLPSSPLLSSFLFSTFSPLAFLPPPPLPPSPSLLPPLLFPSFLSPPPAEGICDWFSPIHITRIPLMVYEPLTVLIKEHSAGIR